MEDQNIAKQLKLVIRDSTHLDVCELRRDLLKIPGLIDKNLKAPVYETLRDKPGSMIRARLIQLYNSNAVGNSPASRAMCFYPGICQNNTIGALGFPNIKVDRGNIPGFWVDMCQCPENRFLIHGISKRIAATLQPNNRKYFLRCVLCILCILQGMYCDTY